MSASDLSYDDDASVEVIAISGVIEIDRCVALAGDVWLAEYTSLDEAEQATSSASATEIRRLSDNALLSTLTADGWLRTAEALPSEYAIAETRGAVEP